MLTTTGAVAQQGTGTVTVFRTFIQAGFHPSVFCDGQQRGRLGRNQYVQFVLPAGHHYCQCESPKHMGVAFDIANGQSLYFQMGRDIAHNNGDSTFFKTSDFLQPVSPEAWGTLQQKLKPAKSNKVEEHSEASVPRTETTAAPSAGQVLPTLSSPPATMPTLSREESLGEVAKRNKQRKACLELAIGTTLL